MQPHAQLLLDAGIVRRRDSDMKDSIIGETLRSSSLRGRRGGRGRPAASATASK
jgi:hypothetical protein